jgi:hypothetical protein
LIGESGPDGWPHDGTDARRWSTESEDSVACHWMLLRLAGAMSDNLISRCRRWLADGNLIDVARALRFSAIAQRTPVAQSDVVLLDRLVRDGGTDSHKVLMIESVEPEQVSSYGFAATTNQLLAYMNGTRAGAAVLGVEDDPADDIDQAAIAEAAAAPAAVAVWRSWRFPGEVSPWPPPRRVYVVETKRDANLVTTGHRLQYALTAAGDLHPQVEAYPSGSALPAYQHSARTYGALIWARNVNPGIKLAVLYDRVDPHTGPQMDPAHPTAGGELAGKLLRYLRHGQPLQVGTRKMDDVLDRTATSCVPTDFVTDGFFVWSAATAYYLQRHRLLPDPELVEHIQRRGYRTPAVDGAAVHRALAALDRDSRR